MFDSNSTFTFPKPEHCAVVASDPPLETNTPLDRQYLASTNGHPGEKVNHLAIVSYSNYFREVYFPHISSEKVPLWMDENCYNEYAEKLVPRAVGYSAALLDYFFRAEMDLVEDEEAGFGYMIENMNDEAIAGTFELYYDNTSDERIKLWDVGANLGPAGSGNEKSHNINFNPPDDAKTPGIYILVFKGSLGNEENHIAGRVVTFETATSDVALLAKKPDGTEYVLYFRMNGGVLDWIEEAELHDLPYLPWQTPTHASQNPYYGIRKDIDQQLVFRLNTPNRDPVMLSTISNGIVLTTMNENGLLINKAYAQFNRITNTFYTATNVNSETVNQFKYIDAALSPDNYHEIAWGVATKGYPPNTTSLIGHFLFSGNGDFINANIYHSQNSSILPNVSIDNWTGGNLADNWEPYYLIDRGCPIGPEQSMDACPSSASLPNAGAHFQVSHNSAVVTPVIRPFYSGFIPLYQDHVYSVTHSYNCDARDETFFDGGNVTRDWHQKFSDETLSISYNNQVLFDLSFTEDSKAEVGSGNYGSGYARRWNGHKTNLYNSLSTTTIPVQTINYTIMDGVAYDIRYNVTTATGTVGDGVCENSSSGDPSNEQVQTTNYNAELSSDRVTQLLINSVGEQSTPDIIMVRGVDGTTKRFLFNDLDITDQVLSKIGTDAAVSFSFCLPQEP